MSEFSKALSMTSAGLAAQTARLRHLSENIANAATPGYRRKTVPFEQVQSRMGGPAQIAAGRVKLDQRPLERIFDPGHPLADDTGHFDGSNVDLMIELADAREAQRTYEANIKMFDQTRQMSASLMELLRK